MQYQDILDQLNNFNITNNLEQAIFLGEADHESDGFTKFSEGTNYRFGRAKLIWPNRSADINIEMNRQGLNDLSFCPQPWLFNLAYGSRMGNQLNGTNDNDGYNYRGAGIFQLTGKNNYQNFLNFCIKNGINNYNINNIRNFVNTEGGAILSAIWFWLSNNISQYAINNDIEKVTKIINGGLIGLQERINKINFYKNILGC